MSLGLDFANCFFRSCFFLFCSYMLCNCHAMSFKITQFQSRKLFFLINKNPNKVISVIKQYNQKLIKKFNNASFNSKEIVRG